MIRGQKSTAVPQKRIELPAKLHNRFDFEIVDSVTGKVKQRAYAENIILNTWWTKAFSTQGPNGYIHVGTGSGTLSATRTSLFTFLSGKSSEVSVNTFNDAGNWMSQKRSATWTETENQNTNWTEVGIAYGTSSGNLTTHALIKDLNGNPVTLHKGTTDIITVYATVYVYLPANTSDIKFNFPRNRSILGGSLLDWLFGNNPNGQYPCPDVWMMRGSVLITSTGATYNSAGYTWDMSFPTPLGSSASVTRTGSSATKTLTITIPRLAAASYNNTQGVRSFVLSTGYMYGGGANSPIDLQVSTPGTWFPYSAVTAETIGTGDGTTLAFNTYFPFLKNDGSFVLKVNGAVVDPALYTINYGEPNGNNLVYHMNVLDFSHSIFTMGANNKFDTPTTAYIICENPWYQKYGIDQFGAYLKAYVSNDMVTWTLVADSGYGTYNVPAQYKNYRYWKFMVGAHAYESSYASPAITSLPSATLGAAKNINFAAGNAPAAGAVITADYHTDVVAKTANNVFDISIAITLQEKAA